MIEVIVVPSGPPLIDRAKLFGEDLLNAVCLEVEFGDVLVGVGVLNRLEGDVLVDHHIDAGRVGVVEDGSILNADVDVVRWIVLLPRFVMLSNRELDPGVVGDRIEQPSQLALRPLILARDAEVEVLGEPPRPREIQLAQRSTALEQEVVTVIAREDTPKEPGVDM